MDMFTAQRAESGWPRTREARRKTIDMGKSSQGNKYSREYLVQDRVVFGQMIMWHGVSMLPALRAMSDESLESLIREAAEKNLIEPLHLAATPQFVLPTNGDKKLTGGEVIAIMIFGSWVLHGERHSQAIGLKGTPDESLCGGLVHNWPEIRDALMIVDGIDDSSPPK